MYRYGSSGSIPASPLASSSWIKAAAGVFLILLISNVSWAENMHFRPSEVGPVFADDVGFIGRRVALGSTTKSLYLLCDHSRQGYYYSRATDGTWTEHGLFTAGAPMQHIDFQLAVDPSEHAHVAFEGHDYEGVSVDHQWIGYKYEADASNWAASATPFWISDDENGAHHTSVTPRVFVYGDSLHVAWNSDGAIQHRARYLFASVADSGWGRTTTVTEDLDLLSIVVVQDTIHFLGVHHTNPRFEDPGDDEVSVDHVYGVQPADPEEFEPWDSVRETIDSFTRENPGPGAAPEEPDDAATAVAAVSRLGGPPGPFIYFVWQHMANQLPYERTLAFRTLDVGDSAWVWTPSLASDPLVLTPEGDDRDSRTADVVAGSEGVHVFWHEQPLVNSPLGDTVLHRYASSLEPSSLSEWSGTANVVADDQFTSYRAKVLLDDDDLLVTYTSNEANGSGGKQPFFRKGNFLGNTATSEEPWNGVVFLDGDFIVPPESTLTVQPATVVEIAPDDHNDLADDSDRVEILVEDGGKLVAVGAAPDSLIVFRSTVADTVFDSGDPGDTWSGIRLETLASAQNGYGFLACKATGCEYCSDCDDEKTEFENVLISDSEAGISIEGNVAPQLRDVSFDNIRNDRDIYLARGDVVLPIDFEWHLRAPTQVVAADTPYTSVVDHTYGTVDRIDLLLEGGTYTDRDAGSSDSVKFRPEVEDASTADNWGGVFLGAHSTHVLKYADFGYATNPLFVDWAGWGGATATIRHSSIHHFGDIGLWIHGTYGDGWVAFVDSCSVFRGSDLAVDLGRVGLLLDAAEAVAVTNNEVSIDGAFPLEVNGSRAIEVYFPAGLCDSTPPFFDCTLSIDGNHLLGPGEIEYSPYTGTSGIFANYVCGRSDREVKILNNWIRDFNYSGLEFSSSRDIQIQCNRVEANQQAVEFRREEEASGAGLRFRTNYLEVDKRRTALIRTENALKTKLGEFGLKGNNELRTHGDSLGYTRYVLEDEAGNSHPALNARHNRWFKNDSLMTDSTEIFTSDFIWTTLPDSISSNWPLVDVGSPDTT
ncbi:hypothetical protein K8I85_05630, partial [bacterium]|nr:hypothetical protein [bacterium]